MVSEAVQSVGLGWLAASHVNDLVDKPITLSESSRKTANEWNTARSMLFGNPPCGIRHLPDAYLCHYQWDADSQWQINGLPNYRKLFFSTSLIARKSGAPDWFLVFTHRNFANYFANKLCSHGYEEAHCDSSEFYMYVLPDSSQRKQNYKKY